MIAEEKRHENFQDGGRGERLRNHMKVLGIMKFFRKANQIELDESEI
jgi:hypothetical protein